MRTCSFGISLFLVLFFVGTARAQDSARAASALAKGDFATAIDEYTKLLRTSPHDARVWEQLGIAYLQTGKYPDAIESLQKAIDNGYTSPTGKYNLACAYARIGEKKHALDLLSEVVAQGSALPFATDPDLASLSDEPRFKELVTQVERKSKHCNDLEYRQFDFWLGNWEVQTPQGQILGRNEVTSIQSGCILMENWTSAAGGQTGTSFNFYDSRDKKWHQLYYDNSGNFGAWPPLIGELKDGKMVLNSLPERTPASRWTWNLILPGKVRQMAEQSDDGGKTWHITWDSVYVKH